MGRDARYSTRRWSVVAACGVLWDGLCVDGGGGMGDRKDLCGCGAVDDDDDDDS